MLRRAGISLIWIVLLIASMWSVLAFDFDVRWHPLGVAFAIAFVAVVSNALWRIRPRWKALTIWAAAIAVVMIWWFTLQPTNNADWQPDVSRLPWAEIHGDEVILHNVRNCDYRTETDYTPHWEDKTIQVSEIRGVDLFFVHWGSPWIAHAILSFQLPNDQHVTISIEARKRVGQDYSALRGFFRQYTLIYIVSEERDVVRLRTNFRVGEDVTLYRTRTTARDAQRLFLAYVGWINRLRETPEWYNALTTNCTTGIVKYLRQAKIGGLPFFDWRTVLNGRGDEMLYQIDDLVSDGLSFTELRKRAYINPVAKQAGDPANFSKIIRQRRPGFTQDGEPDGR